VLSVESTHSYYGQINALKGVSLHVSIREIVALIGFNGAGKTTVLKTIIGLVRPLSGKILFEDRSSPT